METNDNFTHMDVVTILAIFKSSDEFYSCDDKINYAIELIPFDNVINLDDTEIEDKSLYLTHSPHEAMRKVAGLLLSDAIDRKDKINMATKLLEFTDLNYGAYLRIGNIEKIKSLTDETIGQIHYDLISNHRGVIVGENDVSQHEEITIVKIDIYKYILYSAKDGQLLSAIANVGSLTIDDVTEMMNGEEHTVSINRLDEDDWYGDLALAMLKAKKINMK